MTTANKRDQIQKSLDDREYRHQFVEEEINVGIAFQIRALRNRQNLKQGDLAKLLGGKQSLVSSWENPNYGKYTLTTLKDLAKAFDVGLLVRFVPFSTLVDWTVNVSNDSTAPPSFDAEGKKGVDTFRWFHFPAPTKEIKILDASDLQHLCDIPNIPTPANITKEPIHA
jgi:transcriptional regulator with XRE-family HTH domain